MKNNKEHLKLNLAFGQWIYSFFILQVLSIFYSLRGGIILGVFPSVSSIFYIFYEWIHHKKYDLSIGSEFSKFYHKYFWETNKLGWIMLGVGGVLSVDFYISRQLIKSLFIHYIVLMMIGIYLLIFLYLFPVFARYSLKTVQYIKQSFFISFSSISQSIAMALATFIMIYLFYSVPFLFLFFGIPLLLLPIGWFATQGILRAERSKKD